MGKIGKIICSFCFVLSFISAQAEGTNKLSAADEFIVQGALDFDARQFDAAIGDFGKAIKICPTNSFAVFDRATVYRAKGEFKKSIADFDKCISINPTNSLAYANRASDFVELGKFDKALDDWNKFLEIDTNNATAIALRGFCYEKTARFNEAQKDFYQAVQIGPKNDTAWNSLAWFRATCPASEMRNSKEAVETAIKACEFSHWTNWTRVDTLAAAYAEAGNFQLAIKYQSQALEMVDSKNKECDAMRRRLSMFEQKQPYRETSGH